MIIFYLIKRNHLTIADNPANEEAEVVMLQKKRRNENGKHDVDSGNPMWSRLLACRR